MKLKLLIIATLAGLCGLVSAQTSFAEFTQKSSNAIGALSVLKSYSPIKLWPKLTVEADLFGGYDTITNNAVAAFVGALTYTTSGGYFGTLGLGNRADISKSFQLNELSVKNAGIVIAIGKRF